MFKNIFLVTKEFVEKELGCKVISSNIPVTLINGAPKVAKSFKWDSIEELKNDDLFLDTKGIDGIIYLCETDAKSLNNFIQRYVDNFEDAETFVARLFV